MKRDTEIFLGKGGRAHGPFTSTELDEMRASGKIDNYRWIWDESAELWKPLDPPPVPMSGRGAARGKGATVDVAALEALCHDGRNLMAARVDGATETGCVLSSDAESSSPAFGQLARIAINLLDPSSGRSITVAARVTKVSREEGRWSYRLSWDRSPLEMLAA